ncbi:biorientation of chromosomes in cell division protein 1-like 1 isoform X1 [Drosophila navojoa]|uniref:biorientation of chromosomes in cell division protein 1-like 1 isoform X1 n=1 Tax=Drosophila navojoa TaxID=7232 RepID=UPI0008466924|nr:biorientation of chromosomes in cell division protein 1-like 1 isoform X1 [Drosophila navojoa]
MDNFVKTLIEEVKSQGVFDEFRFNCCLADVDTKPAYQNVRNRVETAVKEFLSKQHWTPDTNKVQLRERLRKHLLDSDVLDKGVDHIVDQVVNPKVATIFEPKIESIAYKYLGITPPPPPTNPPPRPPLLPAPPLPPYTGHGLGHMNGGSLLKVETTASLLPTDLEQISPDSDRATVKSDARDDSKDDDLPPGVDMDDILDEDDATSPAFEPASSIKEDTNNASLNTSDSVRDVKELANDSRDAGASQASQLSQVSSDSRLTIASTDAPQQSSTNNSVELTTNIAASMSEEAQMPKFNENSNDASDNSGRQLHFDIKQDAITFEGTERRNSLSQCSNGGAAALSIEDAIMSEVKANINDACDNPLETIPKPSPEPIKTESNFGLFTESKHNSQPMIPKESTTPIPQFPPLPEEPPLPEIKPELPPTEDAKAEEAEPVATTLPTLSDEINKSVELTASPASASSSSQTKKPSQSRDKDKRQHSHSRSDDKQRRKSRERERDHDKSRSKTSSSSKHSSSHSTHSSSSKHRSSSSKNDKSSTTSTSSRSNHDSTSSSKRSSSRHESSSSAHKKHKSSSSGSRSERDRAKSRDSRETHNHSHHSRSHNGSGSSSSSSKRERERDRERDRNKSSSNSTSNSASNSIAAVIQDDHNEVKAKLLKRHSNDSNDEPPGSSSKSHSDSAVSRTKENSTDAAVQNESKPAESSGTNGTNGTNGTTSNNDSAELVAASNVVIVSDMLQQSTASFVELSGGGAAQKPAEEDNKTEATENEAKQAAEKSMELENIGPTSKSPEPIVEPAVEPVEEAVVEPATEPVEASAEAEMLPTETESVEEIPEEVSPQPEDETEAVVDAVADPQNAESIKKAISLKDETEVKVTADSITHFEQDAEEFKVRLQLIEQHIKDRRQLVNVLSELGDTGCPRRSVSKRRLSSEASSSKEQSNFSSSSSSTAGSPNAKAKRTRRDEAKTSPTPSEISVNSKENEEHEKGDLSGRRLSQKLCQQQRYTNDDLYKPRPVLSQRSRRRGLDSIL